MNLRSTLPRIGAVTLTAGIVVATAATPASAHVTVTPNTTAAGEYAVLTFAFGHGCEAAPTRQITISMPEEIPQVAPSVHPGWKVEKKIEKLDEPITDAHGAEITERVAEVVYTAKRPVPDGYRDSFELSAKLPDAAGETLTFPTIQTCTKGETPWIEVPEEGQSADELERPAPAFELTEATGDGHGAAEEGSAEENADVASDNEGGGTALGIGGLALGAVGAALGGAALARTRKA